MLHELLDSNLQQQLGGHLELTDWWRIPDAGERAIGVDRAIEVNIR